MRLILSLTLFFVLSLSFGQDLRNNNWVTDFDSELSFVENKGQFINRNWQNTPIEFGMRRGKLSTFFTKKGLTYRFDKFIKNPDRKKDGVTDTTTGKYLNVSELIHVNWLGSNPNVEIQAEEMLESYYSISYIDYNDKNTTKNINHLRSFRKLTYKNLYPNIDLVYTIHPNGGIKYKLVLKSGADPSVIKMKYSDGKTDVAKEQIHYGLNSEDKFEIETSLGKIIEHQPVTFYQDSKVEINSKFKFLNNTLSFKLDDYDSTREIVIDPWVWSSDFSLSTATREVDCDGSGNSFVIGGEDNMELKKINSGGSVVWTYVTPWDTLMETGNGGWLGTLATDFGGNSYITMGTSPEIEKINNSGGVDWHQNGGSMDEYWSITFNCDKTKLIVGGTHLIFGLPIDAYARIFEIDVNSGNVLTTVDVHHGVSSGFGGMPIEVRSISSSRNAKYAFLTHEEVGIINQNLGSCPSSLPTFAVDNQDHLGYKCETFLGVEQNGGGLKAIIANDNFIFTHVGDVIKKWDIFTGALLATAAIPGGSSSSSLGSKVVDNTGLDVDDNGLVYVGSGDRVLQYDENLNILQQITTDNNFTVYDVSVGSSGELVACGAIYDASNSTNRYGKVQSFNMSAGPQYALVCCDVNICPVDPVCNTDPAFNINVSSPGGTFSGPGIVDAANGTFDPSVAGVGTHVITYAKPCGSEDVTIVVMDCNMDYCSDGTSLTAIGGDGTYTWYDWETVTVTITDQASCESCGGSWNPGFPPFVAASCDISSCSSTDWVEIGTGATLNISTVNSWPVELMDGAGVTTSYNSVGEVPPCSACTPPTVTGVPTHVGCAGNNDGEIELTVTGGSTYNISWSGPSFTSSNEDITNLYAGTYTVTVTDQTDATCQVIINITVNDGTPAPTAVLSGSGDICAGETADLSVIFTGTANWSFDYTLDGTAQSTISGIGSSPYTLSGGAGTYVITGVSDASACPGTVSGTAVVTEHPAVSVSNILSTCNGAQTDYVVTFDISGGDAGSYTVNGVASGSSFTSATITSGTAYSYTVTDQWGCSPVVVSGTQDCNCPVTADISGTVTICNGDATNLTFDLAGGTFPYSFIYTDGTNNFNETANTTPYTVSVSPTNTTTYTLVSVNSGCSGTVNGSAVVTVTPLPTASITGATTICSGSSTDLTINLTGTPNWSVSYTENGNSQTINGIGVSPYTLTVTPGTATTYILTNVSDVACSNTASASVLVDIFTTPDVVISGDADICSGEATDLTFTFNGTAPFDFTYFDGTNSQNITGVNSNPYTISVNPTGSTNYTITAFNDANCTGTFSGSANITIHEPVTVSNIQSTCNVSQSDYLVTFDINNGDFTSYVVTPAGSGSLSGNSFISNAITSGTAYSFTVTDQYGCSPVTVSGTQDCNCPVTGSLSGDATICNGDASDLSFSFAGGVFPYSFTYSDGSSTFNGTANTTPFTISVNPTSTTTYTLVSVNDINCTGTSSGSAVITVEPLPTLSVSSDADICNGNTATITVDFTGNPPFGFTYTDGVTPVSQTGINTNPYVFTVSPTSNTTYTFTDVNDLLCSDNINESTVVNVHDGITVNNIVDACLAGDLTYEVTFDISGGDASSYSVSPSGTLTGSSFTSNPISNATNYSFTIDDAWGCSPQTVSGYRDCSCPVTAVISGSTSICEGETAQITVTLAGGSFPYSIVYTNGTSTYTANNINTSPYTINVTSASSESISLVSVNDASCVGSASGMANITVNPLPSLSLSGNDEICEGQTADLTFILSGTAPFDISYSDGTNTFNETNIMSSPYNVSVSPTVTTTYTAVSISDASCNGVGSGSSIVTVHNLPSVDAGLDQNICEGEQVVLTGSNASSYVWNHGVINNVPFTPITTSTYTVIGTDTYGCENTDQVTVNITPIPVANAGADEEICENEYVTLTASGGATYLWSTTQSTSSIVVQPSQTSTYSVTVYDQGCYSTDEVSVLVHASPIANAGPDVDLCAGESTTLTASGSGTYAWNNGIGNVQQVDVSPNSTTTYSLTVSDNIGCYSTDEVIVNIFDASSISTTPDDTLVCFNQSINITASGADNYTWFPTYGISQAYGSVVQANPSVTTTYIVTGTYGPACQANTSVTITVDKVVVNIPQQGPLCNGETAIINASVTNGVPPYTYLWQGTTITTPELTKDLFETESFTVLVTDNEGCQNSATTNIYVYDSLYLNAYANIDSVCPSDTVLVNASIYGGTGSPYILTIDGEYAQTITKLKVIEDHDYIFVATDGCMSVSDTLRLNTYPLPYIDFTANKYAICEDEAIKFSSIVQPRALARNYIWNFGDKDNSNLSLNEDPEHIYHNQGIYDVTLSVNTINGCKVDSLKQSYINVSPRPNTDFKANPDITTILNPEIYFDNLTNGENSYYWNFGTGDESDLENPLYKFPAVGFYEVILVATTKFGCQDTASRFVKIEPEITIWFPDAFTPDGDGHNEYFMPKGTNIINKGYLLTIYDRWGEPIFETEDLHTGWDGKAKDNDYVKPGIYTYTIKYKDIYEIQHEKAGTVNVIR